MTAVGVCSLCMLFRSISTHTSKLPLRCRGWGNLLEVEKSVMAKTMGVVKTQCSKYNLREVGSKIILPSHAYTLEAVAMSDFVEVTSDVGRV